MEHFRPNPIDYPERYLGSVLGGINVHAKRALAEWRIHNLDDGCRDSANVSVVGHDSGEGLLNFLAITLYRVLLRTPLRAACRRARRHERSGWCPW
jgi:hypothetical protein